MTLIVFYNNVLHDVVAPSHTLRLEAGRGGDPERFWLSNGSRGIFLDREQAAVFLTALDKMNRSVQRGRLDNCVFYSHDIYDAAGSCLGVDLGILAGRPFVGIENARADIGPDDLAYFAAACSQAHYLAGGIGVASRLARTRPGPRPIWEGYASRFCNNGERNWYDD